jgi:thiosulfate dehydrogenase
MKNKFLVGLLVGICVPLLAAYLFVIGGGMPVATKGSPLPLEHFIAKKAIHAAMGREIARPSPVPADEPNLLAGAKVYNVHCSVCHGTPVRPATISSIAKGMYPEPPLLVGPEKGVTNNSVGESFWKVKNGIRLTGMPGYSDSLSETEMWQAALIVAHAHDLPPSVRQLLSEPNAGSH